jgi:hypothetical protein
VREREVREFSRRINESEKGEMKGRCISGGEEFLSFAQ